MRHSDFVPPIYQFLAENEWSLLERWFEETGRNNTVGELSIPFMSLVQGLVMGNRLKRIVQIGTHCGYSALLIGFMLRRMGIKSGLASIDLNERTTAFAAKYLKEAGLDEYVTLMVNDSRSPVTIRAARGCFQGGRPQMVIIDASHEYAQTLLELDSWYDALEKGGFILLHDCSRFAQQLDPHGQGGVNAAFNQWVKANPGITALSMDPGVIHEVVDEDAYSPDFSYQDGFGVGLVFKNMERHRLVRPMNAHNSKAADALFMKR